MRGYVCAFIQKMFKHVFTKNKIPQILNSNLSNFVLNVKLLGFTNILRFRYLDAPTLKSVTRAFESLFELGAIDASGLVTKIGKFISSLSLRVELGRIIFESFNTKIYKDVVSVTSLISTNTDFQIQHNFNSDISLSASNRFRSSFGSDHLYILYVLKKWEECSYEDSFLYSNNMKIEVFRDSLRVKSQIMQIIGRFFLSPSSINLKTFTLNEIFLLGLRSNVAYKFSDGYYKTVKHGIKVHMNDVCVLKEAKPESVFYLEILVTSLEYMRIVSEMPI